MDYSKEEHVFRKKPVTITAIDWNGKNFDAIKSLQVIMSLLKMVNWL